MTADSLVQQIISKHRNVYDAAVPDWKGFAMSCWYGVDQRETVKYYYDSSANRGKQMKTPSVYREFRELKPLLDDPESVHAVVLRHVRDTGATDLRIIRDPVEAEKYQNWLDNPFDIAEAIRPDGV